MQACIYRTVHFDEMRAVLDTDKQNLKSLILERVDELLASGVWLDSIIPFKI